MDDRRGATAAKGVTYGVVSRAEDEVALQLEEDEETARPTLRAGAIPRRLTPARPLPYDEQGLVVTEVRPLLRSTTRTTRQNFGRWVLPYDAPPSRCARVRCWQRRH